MNENSFKFRIILGPTQEKKWNKNVFYVTAFSKRILIRQDSVMKNVF